MLHDLIRKVALDMLAGAVRHPSAATRRLLAEAFWDIKYVLRFGFPKLPVPAPEPAIPWPPRPQPDPSPLARLELHEELLMGLVDILDGGDPDPEPNIGAILRDPGIRLAAARNLMQRLNQALPLLDKEIARLEKQLKQK